MTDFRQHEGWCPSGASPDGRRRLDMFPEWGGSIPLWERGNGCGGEVSRSLADDLRAWNAEWKTGAEPGVAHRWRRDEGEWLADGEALARRVEIETGAVVVMLGPERYGRPSDCPHCGTAANDEDPPACMDASALGF